MDAFDTRPTRLRESGSAYGKYTLERFGKELEEEINRGYDPVRIGDWANIAVSRQTDHIERDKGYNLYAIAMRIDHLGSSPERFPSEPEMRRYAAMFQRGEFAGFEDAHFDGTGAAHPRDAQRKMAKKKGLEWWFARIFAGIIILVGVMAILFRKVSVRGQHYYAEVQGWEAVVWGLAMGGAGLYWLRVQRKKERMREKEGSDRGGNF